MNKNPDRRSFLKFAGYAGLGSLFYPATALSQGGEKKDKLCQIEIHEEAKELFDKIMKLTEEYHDIEYTDKEKIDLFNRALDDRLADLRTRYVIHD